MSYFRGSFKISTGSVRSVNFFKAEPRNKQDCFLVNVWDKVVAMKNSYSDLASVVRLPILRIHFFTESTSLRSVRMCTLFQEKGVIGFFYNKTGMHVLSYLYLSFSILISWVWFVLIAGGCIWSHQKVSVAIKNLARLMCLIFEI